MEPGLTDLGAGRPWHLRSGSSTPNPPRNPPLNHRVPIYHPPRIGDCSPIRKPDPGTTESMSRSRTPILSVLVPVSLAGSVPGGGRVDPRTRYIQALRSTVTSPRLLSGRNAAGVTLSYACPSLPSTQSIPPENTISTSPSPPPPPPPSLHSLHRYTTTISIDTQAQSPSIHNPNCSPRPSLSPIIPLLNQTSTFGTFQPRPTCRSARSSSPARPASKAPPSSTPSSPTRRPTPTKS